MASRLKVVLLALVGICALSGCKSGGESAQWLLNGLLDPTQAGQFREARRTEIRGSLSILEEPVDIQDAIDPEQEDLEVRYEDHRIIPGDVLTISVFELLVPGQNMGQQIVVGNSGFSSLPVLGQVRMAGLTVTELEMAIKEHLREADILPDPEVQVSLVETRGTRFSIIGSIPRPGTYNIPQPDYRLLSAIADAGGLSPILDKVYVFRRGAGGPEGITEPVKEEAINPSLISMNNKGRVPFTMSDVASGPATSASSSAPATMSSELPSASPASVVDEMQILEGGPTAPKQQVAWDPNEGWVIKPISESSSAASGPAIPVETSQPLPEDVLVDGEDLTKPMRIIEVPTKELLMGDPRYNVVIRPYDLVNIPPGSVGEFYMMGNIARPGAYELTGRKLTVKEAVAAAGGFGPLAWPSRADLIRRVTKDEEQIIQLDLDAIFAGNAPDFYLKPNDIVNVGTTPAAIFLAVLRNAFRFSYGFGFVYDRNFADADSFQAQEQVKSRRFQEAQARGLPSN